jgi:hypothetical protein
MLDQTFYWGTIRKAVIAFGNLFNSITIERKDSTGDVIQGLKVPLAYAGKQKFLARIQQRPNLEDSSIQIIAPRMAFEMMSMTYDFDRKIAPIQQSRIVNDTSTTLNAQYAPTPYNIQMGLYIYVKNQDDGLQIIEQILPYFNPDYNLKLIAIPELAIKNNLPVLLDSVNFEDSYEGSFEDRREIVWTLMFTIKLNFYGPANKSGVIKKVIASTFNDAALSNVQNSIVTQVVPSDANVNSYTGFTQSFTDF